MKNKKWFPDSLVLIFGIIVFAQLLTYVIPAGQYEKVVDGPNAGELRELSEEKSVVGRHPDCDVPLDSLEASRHHAQILLVDGAWFVEDLHSRNGKLPQKFEQGQQQIPASQSFRANLKKHTVLFYFAAGAFLLWYCGSKSQQGFCAFGQGSFVESNLALPAILLQGQHKGQQGAVKVSQRSKIKSQTFCISTLFNY